MKPTIGVGIDSSKRKHEICIKHPDGKVLDRLRIRNRLVDLERLLEQIHAAEEEIGPCRVVVNMEAANVYHFPLYSHLDALFEVNLWQPKQAKREEKTRIRKQKTDKRNAETLAMLHRTRTPPKTSYPREEADRFDYRELVRLRYRLDDVRRNLKRRFTRTVFALYPTWEELFQDPLATTSRALLRAFPHPEMLLAAGVDGVREIIREAGKTSRVYKDPEQIVEAVDGMLRCRISEQAFAQELGVLLDTIEHLEDQVAALDAQIDSYWQRVKPGLRFWSHPGVTDAKAAALYCEYGPMDRFDSGDALVAYAGLDNFVYQSGEKRIDGSMTKAGPVVIRRALYETLCSPNKHVPGISEHGERLAEKGKHWNVRFHAGAKKLLRRFFAMERDQAYYTPQ